MKVSLNTVKQYVDIDLSIDELVAKINSQLGGVEEIIDLGPTYAGAIIVRVVSCEDHPNADRLHVCKIDDGGVVKDIGRDENGYIQVVCGAPNVHADMFVVWLPPKSIVPSSFGDKEPFMLDARELRGVLSQGMLASPKELALGDSHEGILEIYPDEWTPAAIEIKPGTSFAKAYGLDDTIIDIENKMFTHRPDCFGQIGVAREIAGITGKQFVSPDWYKVFSEFNSGEGLELTVHNHALDVVPRFMAVALKDITVKPSPVWLQAELVRMGSKPINNIVDVTNYIMLLTAQPTHAYDYDKLRGRTLGVRRAEKDESITLLNHKTYTLDESDIVIIDGDGPVGLAGIMGGAGSEVSDDTKNIVLEVANFDMYTVRKSSMRHGVFTDALARFNKGQSPYQNPQVLSLLMKSIGDVAGGQQASQVFDESSSLDHQTTIEVPVSFVNDRLGLNLTVAEMQGLLQNVELDVDASGDTLTVTPAYWRTDLHIKEDVVEEIGRLYGFDKLPKTLPQRTIIPVRTSAKQRAKNTIRDLMSRSGANEVLTYSFVNQKVLEKSGQIKDEAFQIGNALSPDLQYYRLSVLPSLLDKVHVNIRAGHDEFVLYEIGKGHNKKEHASDDDGLPAELEFVDMVYASKKAQAGAAYYYMRRYVEELVGAFGREVVCKPITEELEFAVTAPFDQKRSAFVHDANTDEFIGLIGELKPEVVASFKLPEYSAAATLDLAAFEEFEDKKVATYVPLSKYPSVVQDISLKTSSATNYETINSTLLEALTGQCEDKKVTYSCTPLNVYQSDDTSVKTTSFRISVASYDKTLSDREVNAMLEAIDKVLLQKIDAQRV